jgi:histone H3/H4
MFKRSADRKAVKRDVNRAAKAAAPSTRVQFVPNEQPQHEEIAEMSELQISGEEQPVQEDQTIVDFSDAQTAQTKRAPLVRQPKPVEDIGKNDFVRLLKSAKIVSASSDVLDAVKEIVPDFVSRSLASVTADDKAITSSKIDVLVSKYLTNGEADVVESISLPTSQIEKLIKPIFAENGYTIKRDGIYMLHHFIESFLIKVLQSADIIAEAGKRTRICGRDLSVAYTVRML